MIFRPVLAFTGAAAADISSLAELARAATQSGQQVKTIC